LNRRVIRKLKIIPLASASRIAGTTPVMSASKTTCFIETPGEQHDATVLPAAGDEDSRFGSGIRTLKRPRLDDVRRAIDGEVLRYHRDVAVLKLAGVVEQRRIVEPAKITCES
jgi:hypothetical protein